MQNSTNIVNKINIYYNINAEKNMNEDNVYLKYKEFTKQYKLSNYDTKKLWKIIGDIATHEEFAKRCSNPYFHHDIKTLGDHILCDAIVTYKLASKLKKIIIQ